MIKKILLGLIALVALLVVVGFLLPAKAHVERSAVIDAPACTIFVVANDFGRFNEWSPWAEIDPEGTTYEFSEPKSGAGAWMKWASEDSKVGKGTQTITASEPWSRIDTRLEFVDQGGADAFFTLAPEGSGTKVTWGFETEFGVRIWERYFGLMFDKWIGADYEKGLAKLKTMTEAMPKGDWCNAAIERRDVEGQLVAAAGGSVANGDDIGAALGEAYGAISAYMNDQKLASGGAPMALTKSHGDAGWVFDAAIPLAAPPATPPGESSPVQVYTTYSGPALFFEYQGPYDAMVPTYLMLEAYAAANGLTLSEHPWEEYVSDPASTPAEDLKTNIYWPFT